jgi:membrane-bound metal-dependent hydrolase YbcI (DUF457 family)
MPKTEKSEDREPMETLAHIIIFYFAARALRLEKKWVGMCAAIAVDAVLIVFGWLLPAAGITVAADTWVPLHFFLHSLLVLPLLFLLLYFGKAYFAPAFVGVFSHITLDIFTHRGFPQLVYPLADASFDTYYTSEFSIGLIFASHTAFLVLFLLFERENIDAMTGRIRKYVKGAWVLNLAIVLLTAAFIIVYMARIIQPEYGDTPGFLFPLLFLNTLFILYLFMGECLKERWLRDKKRWLVKRMGWYNDGV